MRKEIIGSIVAILVIIVAFFFTVTLPGNPSITPSLAYPEFQGSLSVSGGYFERDSEGNRYLVQETVPGGDDYVAIAGSGSNRLALRANGSVVCWGVNQYGQCDIDPENDFIAIAAGSENSVALRSNGSIACWGRVRTGNRSASCTPPAGNDFIAISSGDQQNLALRSNGSIVQWGSNRHGEGEVPPGTGYITFAAGQFCNFALRLNGSITCWGDKECCDLPPEDEYVAISANTWTQHLALTSNGELVAWDNVMGWNHYVPSGTDFVAISVGNGRYVALRSDGTMICWSPTGYYACNKSMPSNIIAISAAPSDVLSITNSRAKEILAAEWQKTKARIKIQPGDEKDETNKAIRTPIYPVTYVIETTLPEVQDSVMTYCREDSVPGFFTFSLVQDPKKIPRTYLPYKKFAIKSTDEAIGEFKTHRLTVSDYYLHGHGPIETADAIVVTNISFGYTTKTSTGDQCFQPVYAFEGFVEKDGGYSFFSMDFVPATENLVAFDYLMAERQHSSGV